MMQKSGSPLRRTTARPARVSWLLGLLLAGLSVAWIGVPTGCDSAPPFGGLTTTVDIEWPLTDTVRVGEPVPMRVTVRNQGEILTNFEGVTGEKAIVDFSSSDSGATLPPETDLGDPADETFEVMFSTTGTHTVTGTSVYGTGTFEITVEPNPIATLDLTTTVPEGDIEVGQTLDISGTLRDSNGDILEDFVGTLAVSTSDPVTLLPDRITLTEEDAGQFSFPGLEFTQLGTQSITIGLGGSAPDAVSESLTWTLIPGPAAEFRVTVLDSPVLPSDPVAITIRATDIRGNTADDYTGTIEILTPGDSMATAPGTVTFAPADMGEVMISGITFQSGISQTLIVRDTTDPDLRGEVIVNILGDLTFGTFGWRFRSNQVGFPDVQGSNQIMITEDAPFHAAGVASNFTVDLPYSMEFEYRNVDAIPTPAPSITGEGMTFFFARDTSDYDTPLPNGMGYGLPDNGTGMSVVIRSAMPREVQLRDSAGVVLASASWPQAFSSAIWVPMRVEIRATGVVVSSNGTPILSWSGTVPTAFEGIGFSAATSATVDCTHEVRAPRVRRLP